MMDPRLSVPSGLLVLLAMAAGGTAQGAWLAQDPSWVVDSAGTPSVSADGVVSDAAKTLDGNILTIWNPQGIEGDWYIVLDLTMPYTLTSIALNNYGDTTHDVRAFKLQKSHIPDGSLRNWQDVVTVTDVEGGNLFHHRQEFGGFEETSRYWRFVITRTYSGYQPWLRELNLYAMSDDVDECADGTDNCHAQATCTNTDGSFSCVCGSGYRGDGVACTDVDECADGTDNCHAQATCTNTEGSFSCVCGSGYSGDGVACTASFIHGNTA
ncbi:uncharacterized protein LOC144877355 [Branchiostoma floridae x Branchiostoma japonicum]